MCFKIIREDGRIKITIFGIKMCLKNPFIDRLRDCCAIENIEYFKTQGTMFPHPIGIVIGKGVKIGKNCAIYQNVTLGTWENKAPKLGNNVFIYPNSVIRGDVEIGNNAVIGAGSIVINNVPDNAVVAGNPAKIIKYTDKV